MKQTIVPFVDLGAQYLPIRDQINAAIQDVVSRCNFILGEPVEEFERAFARFVRAEFAVGVASGLDALRLGLAALDIGPGDEVIIPANTFIATALAVTAVGAKPVLVDCDSGTYNIDVSRIEAAITPRTRAIIPVHLTGQAADMDPIVDLAKRRGLSVVEDAAQASGTQYKGRYCGSIGEIGCFSFYPGKNLGAFGDGGMVTTNNKALAERLRRLRNYGQQKKYEHVEKGLNSRLDTIQAAILNVNLQHLTGWNDARARHAAEYRAQLSPVEGVSVQQRAPYSNHIYHLFMIETEQRDTLKDYLESHGVQTGIHYPYPIHLLKAYEDLGYTAGDFPETEKLAKTMLSLPMYPAMRAEQVNFVCEKIASFFEESVVKKAESNRVRVAMIGQ